MVEPEPEPVVEERKESHSIVSVADAMTADEADNLLSVR